MSVKNQELIANILIEYKCISASCVDKLPDKYISLCQTYLSCEILAQNDLCDSNWSSHTVRGRECAAGATGLVRETCKKSCNTCGNYSFMIIYGSV